MRKLLGLLLLLIISFATSAQDWQFFKKKAEQFYNDRSYDSSALLYKRAIGAFNTKLSLSDKGETWFYYARSLQRLGKKQEALDAFRQAESIFKEGGTALQSQKWITTVRVSAMLDDMAKYEESIRILQEALNFYTAQKDSVQMGHVYHNLAFSHYNLGKTQQAVQYYTREVEVLGNKDSAQLARAYNQLGNIWADDLEDDRKALYYYQQSLALKLPLNDPNAITAAYNNLGITYKDLGQLDKAIEQYDLAFKYAQKTGVVTQQFNPLINMSNIYKRQERYPQALQNLEKALTMVDKVTVRQQHILYESLAIVHNELGDFDKGIMYAQKAVALVKDANDYSNLSSAELNLAKAYEGKKDYEQAYRHFMLHKGYTDSLNEGDRKKDLAELMIKYEAAKKDKELVAARSEIERKEQLRQLALTEKALEEERHEAVLKESKLNEEHAINARKEIELRSQQQQLKAAQLLNQQQEDLLQSKDRLRNRTNILLLSILIALVAGGLFFYQRKRRLVAARQNALELQLAKTEALNKIQEERLRISRELHDNIGSHLTLINATVESMPCVNVDDITPQVAVVKNSLVMSMRELRRTVWLMNRTAVSIDELAVRLRDYLRPVINQQLRIQVETSGNTDITLSDLTTTHVFRIIQEAVNNAIKYAQCTLVTIRLEATEDQMVRFSVTDNGVGFDALAIQDGNGLKNMQYRMNELKGTLTMSSQPCETVVNGQFRNDEQAKYV